MSSELKSKLRNNRFGIATLGVILLLVTVLVAAARSGGSSKSDNVMQESGTCLYNLIEEEDGDLLFECVDITPEPTPTLAPTATPTISATATITPTSTPVVVAPFPSAPLCEEHDNRAYHGLWNEQLGCHYNHHHGDNPHLVDDVLGTDIYSVMGGEISYPWQTFSTNGEETYYENDVKHAGYFWHVLRDMPCDTDPCLETVRILVHQHASGRDAAVRYHSYLFEAATSDGGYVLFGGWADFGDLHSPEGTIVVDVPDNHDSQNCTGAGRHKQHSPAGSPQIIWYGASQQVVGECYPRGFITLSVSVHDVWDYTDPSSPSDFTDYVCYGHPRCRANATTLRAHLLGLNMIARWNDLIDSDGDGVVNWEGHANRYGQLLNPDSCNEYGVDCAPVIFRDLSVGQQYGAANSFTAANFRDYDIYFSGHTSGWSQPTP